MSKDHHGLSRCLSQYVKVSQLFKGFKNAELQGRVCVCVCVCVCLCVCVSVNSQVRFSEGAGEMAQGEKVLTTQACRPEFWSSEPK